MTCTARVTYPKSPCRLRVKQDKEHGFCDIEAGTLFFGWERIGWASTLDQAEDIIGRIKASWDGTPEQASKYNIKEY